MTDNSTPRSLNEAATPAWSHHLRPVNGTTLSHFEQGEAQPDQPTLLFVHATGFHARVWDYLVAQLPNRHVIALEQRGHGRSADDWVSNWQTFGDDLIEFVQALDLNHLIGIGHSMGAHATLDAAGQCGRFASVLALDPVIAEPKAYENPMDFGDMLHPAAKRRSLFDSPEQMQAQLGTKSSFPLFHPRMFKDYCEFGLLPDEGGQLRLACLPEVEARVYMSARSNVRVFDSIDRLQAPVTVVRAKEPTQTEVPDFGASPTWPGLAARLPHGTDLHWSQCSHFIPMEKPAQVLELIEDHIQQWRQT